MKRPDNWTKNELLRAERLNEMIEFSAGNHFLAGAGITGHTGTRIGGGLSPTDRNYFKLVQATEDFDFQITNLGVPDDVPSGMTRIVRLNMQDSVHETAQDEERVYDVLTGLNGGTAPVTGDYFYILFNQDSGRWEKIEGIGALTLVHGIPRDCLENGWYKVELAVFSEEPTDLDGLGEDCDVCQTHDGGTTSSCDEVVEVDRNYPKPTGVGVIVLAHDADGMPLKLGGHVKMVARTGGIPLDSLSVSGSLSLSGSDVFRDVVYEILSGTRMMMKFPAKQVYTCYPDGEVLLTSCTAAIVYGIICQTATASQ